MEVFHQGLNCLLGLKQPSGTQLHHNLENSTCDPLKYTMGSPILIVSICMGKSIRIQRVKAFVMEIHYIHIYPWDCLPNSIVCCELHLILLCKHNWISYSSTIMIQIRFIWLADTGDFLAQIFADMEFSCPICADMGFLNLNLCWYRKFPCPNICWYGIFLPNLCWYGVSYGTP